MSKAAKPGLGRIMAMSILITAASAQGVLLLGSGIGQVGPDLGMGPRELGVLTALFFGSAGLTSSAAGKIVDRIGWQQAVRINAVLISIGLLLIAWLATSVIVLGGLLVAMGAVYGLANPAANQALADHVDPNRRGVFFAIKHGGIPTATLLAGAAVPLIILNVGWRAAFVVAAAIALAVVFIVPAGRIEATSGQYATDVRRDIEPLARRLLVWLGVVGLLGSISVVGLSTFLVSGLVEEGFSAATAGWIQFGGAIFSVGARLSYGVATDRLGGKGYALVAALLAIGGVAFIAFIPSTSWLLAVLVWIGFATAWGWPGLFTYSVVNANSATAASSTATAYSGIFFGAALGPVIVGGLIDRFSFEASWLFAGVCLLTAAAIMAWLSRQIDQRVATNS